MKFLVDESTGIAVSQKLKQMSFDVVSVIESMRGAGDEEILRKAIEKNRVIITNDKDFGWLATFYKPPGIVGHVSRKHSEVLSLLGLTEEGFFDLLCRVLEKPHETYIDSFGSRYFLKKLNDLYLNVVVDEGIVRTAYLISSKAHSRMRRRRWLRRLC